MIDTILIPLILVVIGLNNNSSLDEETAKEKECPLNKYIAKYTCNGSIYIGGKDQDDCNRDA